MADARLRGLERDARRGCEEARARLLLARVRAGAVPLERLRLAAWVGDPAARLALASPPGPALPALVLGLEAWGAEACVRAATALGRVAVARWQRPDPRPRTALAAVEAWLAAPSTELALACRDRAEELWADVPQDPAAWPHVGAWFVAAAVAWTPPPWRVTGPLPAARLCAEAAARCASLALGEALPYYVPRGSVRALDTPPVLGAAVRDALAPWALGPRVAVA